MSTKKQMEKKKKETKKNATITEQSAVMFSYDVARCSLYLKERRYDCGWSHEWDVLEKGSEKTIGQGHEISYDRIKSAASQIKEHISITPCDQNSQLFHEQPHFKIYVKKEYYQITESVKARGVIYTLLQLSDEQKRKGVIAISTGNFAWTLCHCGKKFNVPVTIVMPNSSACESIKMCKQYEQNSRTRVLVQGCNMLETHRIALDIAKKEGLFYINRDAHPNMIIGQATLGIEIAEQMDTIGAVFLPTNDLQLAAGIAMAIKGWNSSVKVIIMEIPHVDSLLQIENQIAFSLDELNILVKHYILPRSCYKDLPEILIDEYILLDETIRVVFLEVFRRQKNYFIEVYSAIRLSRYLLTDNELQRKRVVIPLFGTIEVTTDV